MLRLIKTQVRLLDSSFAKQLYFSALALIKLPVRAAWDYLRIIWNHPNSAIANEHRIRFSERVSIYVRPNGTDIKIFQQIFLLGDCRIGMGTFTPTTIIDGGAHIGCATIYYALKFPNARILAIEAEASNVELLRRNVEGLSNVTVIHAAIFSHAGFVAVSNPAADAWGFQVEAVTPSIDDSRILVPSVTLNELVDFFDTDRVDLVKLDIEGAEIDVFSNSDLGWLASVRMINIELHDKLKPGCSTAFESAISRFRSQSFRTVHNVVWRNLELN